MTPDDLMYSSNEDKIRWHELVQGFPRLEGFSKTGKDKYGKSIPYGCGPHSFKCIKKVCELVQPKKILEIGFNMGYGAVMWLDSSKADLVSIDISDKDETLAAAAIIKERWKPRFNFVLCDSTKSYDILKNLTFDLIFIDGDHTLPFVMSDIELALKLNIKNICFDDWLPQYGPGVQAAIEKFPNIEIVEIMGNIALGKVKNDI